MPARGPQEGYSGARSMDGAYPQMRAVFISAFETLYALGVAHKQIRANGVARRHKRSGISHRLCETV